MTLNEFKAWFKGYTETITTEKPTKAQWERLKAEINELTAFAPQVVSIPSVFAQPPIQQWGAPNHAGRNPLDMLGARQ